MMENHHQMYAWERMPTPPEYSAKHSAAGGRNLQMWTAECGDGFLRVILAEEPTEFGKFERHLSISLADRLGICPPTKRVNDHQALHTVRHFFGRVKWGECVPEGDGLVRNFWAELPAALDEG